MGLRTCLVLAGCALLGTSVVSAHHAVQAAFDFTKALEIKGTINKMEFVNPHSILHIDAKDAKGKPVTWTIETVAAGKMRTLGLARGSLNYGDPVTVTVYGARDGSNFAFLKALTLADGRSITTWFGDPNGN